MNQEILRASLIQIFNLGAANQMACDAPDDTKAEATEATAFQLIDALVEQFRQLDFQKGAYENSLRSCYNAAGGALGYVLSSNQPAKPLSDKQVNQYYNDGYGDSVAHIKKLLQEKLSEDTTDMQSSGWNSAIEDILDDIPLTPERKAEFKNTIFECCKSEAEVKARHFEAM